MQGNGLAVLPVVDDDWQLVGIVTRKNVFACLSELNAQGVGSTIADSIGAQLQLDPATTEARAVYTLDTTPMMINKLGAVSVGVLSEAVNGSVTGFLNLHGRRNVLVGDLTLRSFRPIQVEATVTITVVPLQLTRSEATLDVTLTTDGLAVAKAIVTCQILERT